MTRATDILLVDDSPSDAMLVEAELAAACSSAYNVTRVFSLRGAEEALRSTQFDAALLDLGLPDAEGLETFRRFVGMAPHLPVVVLSGTVDAAVADEAVRLGAQDYLVKGATRPGQVATTIAYAIRRRANLDELERAMRNELATKDCFLSHMSHELRSPLAVIHQLVSLLADGLAGPVSDEQRDHLRIALVNTEHMRTMIDQLLRSDPVSVDRMSLECRPTDLRGLLGVCVRGRLPAATQREIAVTFSAPALAPVSCDPDRIQQVVNNLLDNSLKFTPSHGSVAVTAGAVDGAVVIAITDTGSGIRPENLDRVFDRFVQERDGDDARHGLGLGLFLARQIVEQHGGTIWAESEPDRGTTITFTLPYGHTGSTS